MFDCLFALNGRLIVLFIWYNICLLFMFAVLFIGVKGYCFECGGLVCGVGTFVNCLTLLGFWV